MVSDSKLWEIIFEGNFSFSSQHMTRNWTFDKLNLFVTSEASFKEGSTRSKRHKIENAFESLVRELLQNFPNDKFNSNTYISKLRFKINKQNLIFTVLKKNEIKTKSKKEERNQDLWQHSSTVQAIGLNVINDSNDPNAS